MSTQCMTPHCEHGLDVPSRCFSTQHHQSHVAQAKCHCYVITLCLSIYLCAARLNGAVVRVGDAIPDNRTGTGLTSNAICGTLPSNMTTGVGGVLTLSCALAGRYVSVQLLGPSRVLTLCEVIVQVGGCVVMM